MRKQNLSSGVNFIINNTFLNLDSMEELLGDLESTETDAKSVCICVCVFLKQGSVSLIKEICDPSQKNKIHWGKVQPMDLLYSSMFYNEEE